MLSDEEKKSIKEELREEIIKEMEDAKKSRLAWSNFKNNELHPLLMKKFDPFEAHRACEALATMTRLKFKVKSSINFKTEDMERVKKEVFWLVRYWFGITE